MASSEQAGLNAYVVERYSLNDPPSDGISSLKFGQKGLLVCASWDRHLRVYDIENSRGLVASFRRPNSQLCAAFCGDETRIAGGGVDGEVCVVTGEATVLGTHNAGVRCLEYSEDIQAIYTGSWDATVRRWDARAPGETSRTAVKGKVYAMSLGEFGLSSPRKLVIATSDRSFQVYDARKLDGEALESKESPLKYQTRDVACFPSCDGFALSSIEGRIAVEYFQDQPKKSYSFKCHRNGNLVYPVNCLAVHPVYGTFASGGTDGLVNLWDPQNKKRLAQLEPAFPTSISGLAFNKDGTKLAIASSYAYEQGEKDHPPDNIYIHTPLPHEVLPKNIPAS